MEDLFGMQVDVYRGHPINEVKFTEEEADTIVEELIYGGAVIELLGRDLAKLDNLHRNGDTSLNAIRREAWSGLMWMFDLWEMPTDAPFDAVCEAAGADAENIRNCISVKYADEIRLLFNVVTAKFPEERMRLHTRLSRYVDLSTPSKLVQMNATTVDDLPLLSDSYH